MKRLFYITLVAALCAACSHGDHPLKQSDKAEVSFVYDTIGTKTLQVNDTYISNCNIMMYDTQGHLVSSSYCPTGKVEHMSLTSVLGNTYKFYCVCNIGDITSNPAFATETGLRNYQYSVNSYSDIIDAMGAVPMSGSTDYLTITNGMTIYIDLTRCVALVSIRIDSSELENSDISINSIQIRNAASKVGMFTTSAAQSAQDCTYGGDYAAPGELTTFNNGDPVGFYMFENSQGVLLPGNTSCTTKYFSSGSIYEQLCSYVELEGYYNDTQSDNPRHGNFTYRFYLGENTTTDFSVVRNHHYHIVLKLHDNGVDEDSWRVDEELSPYATLVRVIPPEYTFVGVSGTTTLRAEVLPPTASQSVTWSSGNPAVATIDQNGVVTPHAVGQAVIRATVTDGSGVFGTGIINVVEPTYPIRIKPNYLEEDGWMLGGGSQTSNFYVTVYYANGTTRFLTGADALTTIDNDDEWIIQGNTLSAPDETTSLELLLSYTENGRTVTFCSEGMVVRSEDFFTAQRVMQVAKKYGDTDDKPLVVYNIICYSSPLTDLSERLVFTSSSNLMERSEEGFRIKGDCTYNGDISFTITGSLVDDFGNPFSKTISFFTTVFEYRKRCYRVLISTMVREHIDVSYGSQEPFDNIYVRITLVKSWTDDEHIASYYYPASYDENGDLIQGNFTYTWYNKTMTVHMQDVREFDFDYDSEGNLLLEGFCYDEQRYIYYEPL